MTNDRNKRGLGRGLSALMADTMTESDLHPQPPKSDTIVPIEVIEPNPDQPRRIFNESALQELAESIREKGIIQPIIVRKSPRDDTKYEIVAGERRWRASQIAKLHEVPVIVRNFTDAEVLEVAIIENIQRADLNALDEAAGYQQLMDRFGHTQENLASALGKSRSYIANMLRLLNLPSSVQTLVSTGELSAGHARALVGHEDADKIAQKIVAGGLSVRDAERLAKENKSQPNKGTAKATKEKDADTRMLENELSANLKMKVDINQHQSEEKGILSIKYKDLNELDTLLRKLSL